MCFPKGGPGHYPKFALQFLTVPPLSLHPFPSLIRKCLLLISGTLGRQWRLKPISYKQETGTHTGFCAQSPIGSCSVSSLYSRMYRNMDTMIFSLDYSLSISFQFRAILCVIYVLYFKNPLQFIYLIVLLSNNCSTKRTSQPQNLAILNTIK